MSGGDGGDVTVVREMWAEMPFPCSSLQGAASAGPITGVMFMGKPGKRKFCRFVDIWPQQSTTLVSHRSITWVATKIRKLE